jgi:hypothetical protein
VFPLRVLPLITALTLSLYPVSSLNRARAGEVPNPGECIELLTSSIRKIETPLEVRVKYLVTRGEKPAVSGIQTHHLKMMLGEVGDKVDVGLYEDAKSILFLADGSEARATDRLGPLLAREFPGKTVVSADVDVGENRLIRNWGHVKIDHLAMFPVKDNSFDRVILRQGLCQCHSNTCCAGFNPQGPQAKKFFQEVVRVLDKNNPGAFAVLHGMHNVGGSDVQVWKSMLNEISLFNPVEYEIMLDKGFFHSILIRPATWR